MTTATRRRAEEGAANCTSLQRVARGGLVGKGLIEAIVGVLVIRIAISGSKLGTEASVPGALASVTQNVFGRVLVTAAAVGLLGAAVWRGLDAARDRDEPTRTRVASGFVALFYVAAAVFAARFVIAGGGNSNEADERERDVTAAVLQWPFGRWLVAAAGVVLFAIAAAGIVHAFRQGFREPLKEHELDRAQSKVVDIVGVTGHVGRSVALCLVGVFLTQAAVSFDPEKASGLDDSLRRVSGSLPGRLLVLVVGVGLLAAAAFSLLEARYRQVLRS